ncbi:MAG: hypothetical protein MI867_08395 [Pseudomonadales bacterium]|nr:hypothetical protein [Pseudomonadales bacterium]
MNEEQGKTGLKQTKEHLLDDLEDLSGMLDDDPSIQKELTQPYDLEDLPVLKSFVEDVPTLNQSLQEDAEEAEVQITPVQAASNDVEDDPLAISPEVRQRAAQAQINGSDPEPVANEPAPEPNPAKPSGDNPFLPKSALDRLKADAVQPVENKASQELRNLVKQRSLPNFDPNSKEFLALRNDASKMVNEVIKLFIPRMEAELRMRLEKEVDEYLNELRKNAKD